MQTSILKLRDSSFKVLKLNEEINLEGVSLHNELKPNTLCFIKNKQFFTLFSDSLKNTNIKTIALILEESFYKKFQKEIDDENLSVSWLAIVESVPEAMSLFSKFFYDEKFKDLNYFVDGRQMGTAEVSPYADIAQNVFIGEGSKIAANVKIYSGAVIMPNVTIDEGSIIFPNVTIYPYTSIGRDCRIHSGTTIGADGYGYHYFDGAHQKIWQFGGVEIHDNVEIGANSAVDCGTFTPTVIGEGTKVDNLVQIAHNCKIGKHVIICGQVGLAGSVTIEDYVVMAGNSGAAPGAVIKKGTVLAARAAVSENSSWPEGSKLGGFPAENFNDWLKGKAAVRRLVKGR